MTKVEETFRSKIPKEVRANATDYSNLLAYVRTFKIMSISQLKTSLKQEMETCQSFINNNKTSQTNNRILREYSRKLDHFKRMKKLVDKYL